MKTGTSVEYAVRRFKTHVHRFERCARMVEQASYDEGYLRAIAERDSLFPDIDYRVFQSRPWL
jgi:1,4-alpha-glucan branching enzyme